MTLQSKMLYTCSLFIISLALLKAQDFQISTVSMPSSYNSALANGISQDPYGNIWMSTGSQGVVKYNGKEYTYYNSERNNANSLVSDRLECIHADQYGFIWIGSFSGGMSRYDMVTETFTNYIHDDKDSLSIRSNAIRCFAEDDKGGIWIGTAEGIDYWNLESGQFEHHFAPSIAAEILQKEHVRVLYMDKSGILWAGTSSPFYGEQSKGGLFKIDPASKEVTRYLQEDDLNSLTDNIVTAIYEDSRGNFWIGTAGDGLHTMNRELGKFQRHTFDPINPTKLSRPPVINAEYAADHIRFINEDVYGRIWIGTFNNGINLFDPNDRSVIHLNDSRTDEYRLPYNDFWNALFTKDNLIWLTGWSPANNDQVLFKVNLNPKNIKEKLLGARVNTFKEDSSGRIYAGYENSIEKLNIEDQSEAFWNIPNSGTWQDIQLGVEGDLWISSTAGLVRYNTLNNNGQIFPVYDTDLAIGELLEVTKTQQINFDSIIVGTSNGLFLFHVRSKRFEFIPLEIADRTDRTFLHISDLLIDHKKNIWVGIANFGLIKLSTDLKTIKRYKFQENVQDTPRSIMLSDNNELYVGNWRSGLRKFDYSKDSFSIVADETGRLQSDSDVFDVLQLSDNKFLLITRGGVLQYDLKSNTTIAMETSFLNAYDLSWESSFISSEGFLYLGTSTGYVKFKPEELSGNKESYIPEPKIIRMAVGDQIFKTTGIDLERGFHLKHHQNNVAFKLSYINFLSIVKEGAIQYKLENHDEHWQNGQNEQEVYYFKLTPGQYIFRLKAQSETGEWSEDELMITINPPWWRTWWAYSIYGLLFLLGAWTVHRIQKERTIRQERERARERELIQAREIEKAYSELKATQAQLIQSEKMASLGELTAGIAHEIQNPLNFVNNFSEVNKDILEDIRQEINQGNIEEVRSLIDDAISNEEKILHHGQRADAIVKGMLQHSRTSTGQKEPTDINALCNEYLRLSYHGLKAKDHSFFADFKTVLDPNLPLIGVIPQDIGRVLLNLMNNAFQSVHDELMNRQKADKGQEDIQMRGPQSGPATDAGYAPKVIVTTKRNEDKIEIRVSDNGTGIPDAIRDKIFQPFFTTKPTGQGTGLGLSLSYDIVKAHGGELKVETVSGSNTTFIVILPYRINE